MGYDPNGDWDLGSFFEGVSLLSIGIVACVTAATVVTGGACAPLLVAATATFVAGGMTVANGASEVLESVTGYNVMRDGVYGGDVAFYEAQKQVFATVAEIGTAVLGMASQNPGLCFVAGTMILIEEGAKEIEAIEEGDLVWAWDEETGDVALKKVVETYVNETSELVHIFVNGEEIVATPAHPFYSPVKGWTDAVQLRAGDILVLVNGEYVVVEKVQHEILEAPVTVYNFQVEDYHTYYVANGVLVHNSCDYKPLRDGDMRAVINPGELEAPHAHIFQKANNIGRVFSDGTMDASLLSNRDGMKFLKKHYDEIMALIGDFYGKR